MGVVVAAHHLQLDEKVALKFLLPGTLGNQEAVARFAREARAAVKIRSEHVARVIDVGTLENGAPYMVMEYLDGGDLAAWLEKKGPLPIEQAVEFVLQACEALAEAHALGIVHRDLKPANLFVIRRPDGMLSVKVLDFGISKVTKLGGSAPSDSMTKTTALMGSPLYMSPEQMQSAKDVDARSDIWTIGIVLYELLTGASPFVAETMPELVLKVVTAPPRPPGELRPEIQAGLAGAILRCLEKDRANRFQSIGALAVALLPFGPRRARGSVDRISGVMQSAGISSADVVLPAHSDLPPPDGKSAAGARTAASWGKTTPGPGGGKLAIGTGLGIVAAALVALAVVLSRRHAEDPDAPDPTHTVQAPTSASTALLPTRPEATTVSPPPAEATASAEVVPSPSPSASSSEVRSGGSNRRASALSRPGKPPARGMPVTPAAAPTASAKPAAAEPPPASKPNVFDDRK